MFTESSSLQTSRHGRVSNVPRSRLKLHLWIPFHGSRPSTDEHTAALLGPPGMDDHKRSFDALRKERIFLPTKILSKERRSNEVRSALSEGCIERQKICLAARHRGALVSHPRRPPPSAPPFIELDLNIVKKQPFLAALHPFPRRTAVPRRPRGTWNDSLNAASFRT